MHNRRLSGAVAIGMALVLAGAGGRILADCSAFDLPFTDLGSTSFCAQIAEAYFSGLTNGTSATGYSPSANVPREQMAAFVTRTLDQSLLRGNRRAALNQWWTQTPHYDAGLGLTTLPQNPSLLASDGADIWVASEGGSCVYRIRASDGVILGTWTGATGALGVLVAMGKVFVTGSNKVFMIDPTLTPGPVTTVATVGNFPNGIGFDGNHIWTANDEGSVSIITPGATLPWSVTSVTTGFTSPRGVIFDGSNIWVTDTSSLFKLSSAGAILQTATVGATPLYPSFDGHNIWVPNIDDSTLTVVRASDGTVLKTFSSANGNQNGLNQPVQAAFDGQRILVSNGFGGLSLFKATDLSIIGSFAATGLGGPTGVCSDGVNFWVSGGTSTAVARF